MKKSLLTLFLVLIATLAARADVDSTGEIDGNDLNALINILLGKN
jgi:hypothetical protein